MTIMTGLIIAIKDNGFLDLISIAAPTYVSDIRMCRKLPLLHTLRPDFTSQLELRLTSSCFILS